MGGEGDIFQFHTLLYLYELFTYYNQPNESYFSYTHNSYCNNSNVDLIWINLASVLECLIRKCGVSCEESNDEID